MMKLQVKLRKMAKNPLFRGFTVLLSGTVVTQVVSILSAPILSRLYTPAQYGVNSLYTSMLTIFGVLATLRLTAAIAISNKEKERQVLTQICLAASAVIALLVTLAIALFGESITRLWDLTKCDWLWALGLSTFLLGAHETAKQNLLSRDRFRDVALVAVIQALVQILSQMALSLLSLGYMGLIVGTVLSYIVSIIFMVVMLRPRRPFIRYGYAHLVAAKRRHVKFILYALPSEILSIVSLSSFPLVLGILYSVKVAGYYSLANRILGIPIGLIGNSIRQVYLREASKELASSGSLIRSFSATSKILIAVAFPCAAVMYALGPMAFRFAFGAQWGESGQYVRAMTMFFLARMVVIPIMSTVNILNKQHISLIANGSLLILIVGLTLAFRHSHQAVPVTFLWCVSCGASVIFAFTYMAIWRLAWRNKQ